MSYENHNTRRLRKLATQPTRTKVNDSVQEAMTVLEEIDRDKLTDPDFVRLMTVVAKLIEAVINLALLEVES